MAEVKKIEVLQYIDSASIGAPDVGGKHGFMSFKGSFETFSLDGTWENFHTAEQNPPPPNTYHNLQWKYVLSSKQLF